MEIQTVLVLLVMPRIWAGPGRNRLCTTALCKQNSSPCRARGWPVHLSIWD